MKMRCPMPTISGAYDYFDALPRIRSYEFILSAKSYKENTRLDVGHGQATPDYGYHAAPTVYFPLIVDEALMIELTETETKETLDEFVQAMTTFARARDPRRSR